ncbi:hypothetical protein CEXT_743111 [Caerostris extrusa]|uniref:Uncharacterized protein n=1 Tax=Caerostris extrusa TaxID=172846 RepID=A0AAV4MBV5_CAEEX|nr:hypothetical protein CEXT_743111 [Caerostris extrusa]
MKVTSLRLERWKKKKKLSSGAKNETRFSDQNGSELLQHHAHASGVRSTKEAWYSGQGAFEFKPPPK